MIRVFFSYSHDSAQHSAWVQSRAADLTNRGFEVILDQANLKFGQDIDAFMESAIESADFVLLICTPAYAAKANGRSRTHGVGRETVIINVHLGKGATDKKFIAVLKSGTEENAIPTYMGRTLYVDQTRDDALQKWEMLCSHMKELGEADQIGTLVFKALFSYDPIRIYDQPRLDDLKRFTEFVQTGQAENGQWFVVRRDPIKNDLATILFQDPMNKPS